MAQASVIIGADEILGTLWSEIEVRQTLNQHWSCRIILRNTLDARPDVESLLGKPLKISTNTIENGENVIFTGTVIESRLIYEVTGSFGAVIEAFSDSWKLDQSLRQAYFKKEAAQQIANTILSNNGLSLAGSIPAQSEMTYVQWNETDYNFILRLVDDAEAWMRPSSNSPGLEVLTAFQSGPTLEWRQGEFGLLEWQTHGRLRPLMQSGAHYDTLPMQSQTFTNVQSDTGFFGSAAQKMVAAAKQQGTTLPAMTVVNRNRAITLSDYQGRLQKESRRSLATSVTCNGASRDPRVCAGNTVTVSGLSEVDASYGVIECVHRWTPQGYENHFTATPAQKWLQPDRPARPSLDGLYPARVVDNHDPHNQGRIRVQYWWQETSETTWVRLISSHAGADQGILFFPEIGDEVAIAFEEGDVERPYILGCLWNGVQQPPSEGYWSTGQENGAEFSSNYLKRVVTKSGHRITLADNPGQESITLATPKNVRITLTEKTNETGRPAIVLESQGDILLSAPNGRIHFRSATNSKQTGV